MWYFSVRCALAHPTRHCHGCNDVGQVILRWSWDRGMFSPRLRALRKSRTFAKLARKKASDLKAEDRSKEVNPVDLITNAGARSNWQLALQFWRDASRGGSTATTHLADATIRALGRGMQWEQSTTFLREEIISPASHASTLRIVAEATAWMHCLEILSTMQLRRVHPSTACLNTTLVSCGRRFKWQVALNLLVTHLPSSISSLSKHHSETNDCKMSILTALQVAHQWEQALALYANSDLSASHMTMVMEACKRSYAWEAALTLLGDRPLQHSVHMVMRTCAASSEWEATLSLLQSEPQHVSTALSALAKAMQWERGIQLFYENIQWATPSMNSGNVKKGGHGESELETTTYRSLLRVLGGGSHWRSALQFLENLKKPHEDAWTLSAAVWACQAAGQEEAAQQLLAKSLMSKRRKELDLLEHLTQFGRQTAAELLTLIENYAHENRWLKVAGGEKAQILKTHIKPGDRVLELGTYIGFTSLRLASHGCQVVSIEADPLNAAVAQKILSMTNEVSRVKMCVGRASDWLSCGLLEPVDVLLLDHRGTIYHEDLQRTSNLWNFEWLGLGIGHCKQQEC